MPIPPPMKHPLIALALLPLALQAQPGRVRQQAEHIRTVRWTVDADAQRLPVVTLGGTERLELSFDDLTHEYRRYTWTVTHIAPDGTPTDGLFETDYITNGGEPEPIDTYAPGTNTTVLYNHYRIQLPTQRVRLLKSGSYLLRVSTEADDGSEQTVIATEFAVVDPQLRLTASCTTDTDIDHHQAHQQLTLTADLGTLPLRNATEEFRLVVLQNGRTDNAVTAPAPTSQSAQLLRWEHCPQLIFPATNEWRKMEFLSTRYPGMHGESMRWFDPLYHYTLQSDAPRRHYLYDEDADGISIIRSSGATDPDTEADYALTHFTLQMPRLEGHDVYVSGRWAGPALAPECRMTYDEATSSYQAAILLKEGYYNYLYLAAPPGATCGDATPVEGNFAQAENRYTFLAYYRPTGTRYWQLIAAQTLRYGSRP